MKARRPESKLPAKKACAAKKVRAPARALHRQEQTPDGVRLKIAYHFDAPEEFGSTTRVSRLARESLKLSPAEEVSFAELGLNADVDGWPEY